jgi:hypothetical protein
MKNIKKQYTSHHHSDNSSIINDDKIPQHSHFINGSKKFIENNYYVNPGMSYDQRPHNFKSNMQIKQARNLNDSHN